MDIGRRVDKSTDIFIIDPDAECRGQSPIAEDGRAIGAPDGPDIKDVNKVIVRLYKGNERLLRECIAIGSWHYLVVSHCMYGIMQDFQIDSEVECLPAEIVTWDKTLVDKYLFVYSNVAWDVLDYDRAETKNYPGTSVLKEVVHWVIAPERVPDADLFCAGPRRRWMVSLALRDALTDAGITGCKFVKVD